MQKIEEKFDQHRIDSLKRLLLKEAEKGRKKSFEIIVDGFKVVPRTEDIAEFEDYETEISEATRNVTFVFYDGPKTPRNNTYSFSMDEPVKTEFNTATALGDIDRIVTGRMNELKKDHLIERLQERIGDLEEQLAQSQAAVSVLKTEKEELTEKGVTRCMPFGALALSVFTQLHKTNPEFIRSVPLIGKLPGLMGLDDTKAAIGSGAPEAEDTQASFEARTGDSEDEKQWQAFKDYLQQGFSNDQLEKVIGIIHSFKESPEFIELTIRVLNNATKQSS